MFSGKSEELIRRLRRAQIAKQRVAIFKPQMDTRYSTDQIISHSDQKMPSLAVKDAHEILTRSQDAMVVGIDEGQFFGPELTGVCDELASQGKRVIVAGLDQDYLARPFEPMPQIMAIAESITKTLAICVQCGNPANRTQRITSETDRVLVGAIDKYEARCRNCYRLPGT
jgi:thymidine kinase